jgi:hypothetical protein
LRRSAHVEIRRAKIVDIVIPDERSAMIAPRLQVTLDILGQSPQIDLVIRAAIDSHDLTHYVLVFDIDERARRVSPYNLRY